MTNIIQPDQISKGDVISMEMSRSEGRQSAESAKLLITLKERIELPRV